MSKQNSPHNQTFNQYDALRHLLGAGRDAAHDLVGRFGRADFFFVVLVSDDPDPVQCEWRRCVSASLKQLQRDNDVTDVFAISYQTKGFAHLLKSKDATDMWSDGACFIPGHELFEDRADF